MIIYGVKALIMLFEFLKRICFPFKVCGGYVGFPGSEFCFAASSW